MRAALVSRSTRRRAPLLPSGCPLGLMDKASDFHSEDCGFESRRGCAGVARPGATTLGAPVVADRSFAAAGSSGREVSSRTMRLRLAGRRGGIVAHDALALGWERGRCRRARFACAWRRAGAASSRTRPLRLQGGRGALIEAARGATPIACTARATGAPTSLLLALLLATLSRPIARWRSRASEATLAPAQDSLAERSKAVAQGAIPKGRGLEPHSCHPIVSAFVIVGGGRAEGGGVLRSRMSCEEQPLPWTAQGSRRGGERAGGRASGRAGAGAGMR